MPKISALASVTTPTTSDEFPVNQNSTTKKVRWAQLQYPAIIDLTTDATLSATCFRGSILNVGGEATYFLPPAVIGYHALFSDASGGTWFLDPNSSDAFVLLGTTLDAGDKIKSPANPGDAIYIFCSVTKRWTASLMNCVFTDGS
jgi:hypothetical protein